MNSYTLGQTPEAVIRQALPDRYRVDLNLEDFSIVRDALRFAAAEDPAAKAMEADITVRLGLDDPELAAIYKKHLNLARDEMIILLRALAAFGLEQAEENAVGLRVDILSTLDIEEI